MFRSKIELSFTEGERYYMQILLRIEGERERNSKKKKEIWSAFRKIYLVKIGAPFPFKSQLILKVEECIS